MQGGCDGKECDTISSPHSGVNVGNSSIMGSGGASTTSRSNKYNVNKQIGASNVLTSERGAGMGSYGYSRDDTDVVITSSENGGGTGACINTGRETHSCPSSPTETDCSSGFSTLRKRSVTVTEKVIWSVPLVKIPRILLSLVIKLRRKSTTNVYISFLRSEPTAMVAKHKWCASTDAILPLQMIQKKMYLTNKIPMYLLTGRRLTKVCFYLQFKV